MAFDVEKIEAKIDISAAMKDCLDVSEKYRTAGQKAAEQIERTSKLTTEVRDTCDAMRAKLAG